MLKSEKLNCDYGCTLILVVLFLLCLGLCKVVVRSRARVFRSAEEEEEDDDGEDDDGDVSVSHPGFSDRRRRPRLITSRENFPL